MTKPVRLRTLAADDVDGAIDHYLHEAGDTVADQFVDALEHALTRIGRHSHAGSLRFAFELEIPALWCIPLARVPYVVFYFEAADRLDVWRVLHTRRDILSTLADS